MADIDTMLSAGHAEYLPSLLPPRMEMVWPPTEFGIDQDIYDLGVEQLHTLFVVVTGENWSDTEIDLAWEHVLRFRCDTETMRKAVDEMVTSCVLLTPSGDDDTFDYWPSGVRLTVAMAALVDDAKAEQVRALARETIGLIGEDFADELLDACGVRL